MSTARVHSVRVSIVALAATFALCACDDPAPPRSTFYDERISPIFQSTCTQQTSGCHVNDGNGSALGNLDVSSFDALMRRSDVIPPYGPYPRGALLLKAGESVSVPVQVHSVQGDGTRVVQVETDIRHNAGTGIFFTTAAFSDLLAWIDAGFTRTGAPDPTLATSLGACVDGAGSAPGFDASAAPANADVFATFRDAVQPILREGCAGSRCHGNEDADLYLTCGDSEADLRWNYFVTLRHLSDPTSISPLLRRPLAASRGGAFHEGGDVFANTADDRYQQLFAWAVQVAENAPDELLPTPVSAEEAFYADRVQPALVREGCMFLGCHSPAMFHDLRLRGGSSGAFSSIATHRNYEMAREMLALESTDPNESRLIAKNLFTDELLPNARGMAHRGGALFEDFGGDAATLDDCAGVDADAGDINEVPSYCILARWFELERAAAVTRGEVADPGDPLEGLVWVERPAGLGDVRDFDTFRGGADLRFASTTVAADQSVSLGAPTSLLGGCGLGASPDVRTPAVDWDGSRVVFAARADATSPLRLYEVATDGGGCQRLPGVAPSSDSADGILLHDFDPAFAPDGRLVFASTRGNLDGPGDGGPTRTPAALQPNANLYIQDEGGAIRQLTYLLNQEVAPSFMTDGRLIFTAEKRAEDFHQLALRRQNLDGGDYHPLFAQRDSVGFERATEVIELPNRNLVFVGGFHDTADGGGALVVVNRSVGPDQSDRPATDRAYLHSMRIIRASALRDDEDFPDVPIANGGGGVFRSPTALPTGRVVASCDLGVGSLEASRSGNRAYALCELDPVTGATRELLAAGGASHVEAAAVYARAPRHVFESRLAEVNGATFIEEGSDRAEVHILDAGVLASLLFANTREGRVIDPRLGGLGFVEPLAPPNSATSFDGLSDTITDAFGTFYAAERGLGAVLLEPDASTRIEVRGGRPLAMVLLDRDLVPLDFPEGAEFSGRMRQRETTQFYPGERARQAIPRERFAGLCGGCHGSITGRELDIRVDVDALTSASVTDASLLSPVTLSP